MSRSRMFLLVKICSASQIILDTINDLEDNDHISHELFSKELIVDQNVFAYLELIYGKEYNQKNMSCILTEVYFQMKNT